MSDIRAGDLVVRVRVPVVPYASPDIGINNGRPDSGRHVGRVARVLSVVGPICGHYGLVLDGWPANHPSNAHPAIAFRKIEAPRTELSERIRKCRPVPAKVDETALDRLAARLGEGRMSPEVANSLRDVTDRDAAYGRMIEASIARDDAGYERAKAEFWGRGS